MNNYRVNKNTYSNPNGHNEVHKDTCQHYHSLTNFEELGAFSNCANPAPQDLLIQPYLIPYLFTPSSAGSPDPAPLDLLILRLQRILMIISVKDKRNEFDIFSIDFVDQGNVFVNNAFAPSCREITSRGLGSYI